MSYNLICQKTFSRACKTFILYAEIHACVTLVTNPPLSIFTSSHGDGVVDEGDNHEGSQGAEAVLSGIGDAVVHAAAAAAAAAAAVDEAAGPEILEWEWVPWTRPKVQRNSPCLVQRKG